MQPSSQGGQVSTGVKPLRLAPIDVGVASMNMFRQLSSAHALQDARKLTSRRGVDVVGWQEAEDFGGVLHDLPGWQTKTYPYSGENSELAISWRSSRFRLVSADQKRVAYGVSSSEGRYPFGNRLVAQVTLADRETGRLLTVINVHLPQKIEDFQHHPGHWTDTKNAFRARNQLQRLTAIWGQAQGRWVIGTGDFNFDARADKAANLRPVARPVRCARPPSRRTTSWAWASSRPSPRTTATSTTSGPTAATTGPAGSTSPGSGCSAASTATTGPC